VVLGPGFGKSPGAQRLARDLVQRVDVPLVIDADGLNALAGHLDELRRRPWPTVLTPHAGELGRMLEVDSAEVARRRAHHVRAAASRAEAIVVLKGDDTLVADPDGRMAISPGGAPGLATAGTGDVLSGVTAALLAKGLDPFHGACAAVFAHLSAGRIAAEPHGPDGVIASDVIAALPAALAA
jgi:NAD(P)H-hydrate epimerase